MDSRIIGKIMCVMSFEAEVSKMNLVAATKGFSLKKKKKKKSEGKEKKRNSPVEILLFPREIFPVSCNVNATCKLYLRTQSFQVARKIAVRN